MNRQQIVDAVASEVGVTKKLAEDVINSFLNTVQEDVSSGNKVQLMGFGSWELKERAQRVGKNPRTGEKVIVPACKSPVFKPAKVWKDECNK